MIAKGAGDIRGLHSLNTRPGPLTEATGLMKLYHLAAEKENLMKKLEWVRRQREKAERRLSEILHVMHAVKKVVEEKTKNRPVSLPNSKFLNMSIKY